MLNKIIIGGLGIITSSVIIEYGMSNYNTKILQPIDTISIIMASYNEEDTILQSIQSVRNQSIIQKYPQYFDIILVDSNSTDNTVNLAENYVDEIIMAPKGKLTSRRIATSQTDGNIIVSVDADTFYPYHWLNTLLEPFNDIKTSTVPIVASVGNTLDYSIPFIPGPVHTLIYTLDRALVHPNQLPGRNCAYWKHYFYLSGQFDESINQFDIGQMYVEEEISFGERMSKFGKIVFKNNASCIHLNGKRIAARLGLCDQIKREQGIGTDRF